MCDPKTVALSFVLGLGLSLGSGPGLFQPSASAFAVSISPNQDLEAIGDRTPESASKQGAKQDALLRCRVVGIRTGQLALRFNPNGASRAGLNNGNIVDVYQQEGIWFYVQVVAGPNQRVTGLWGWVNGNYLACND